MRKKKLVIVLAVGFGLGSVFAVEAGSLTQRVLDAGVKKIVFATRGYQSDNHWYANFGYYFDGTDHKAYGEGVPGRLSIISVDSGEVTDLLEDETGGVRDPQLSYDGKTILFSYRPGGTEHYHLYRMNVDGGNLIQLTDGGYDDIEPTYLPGGGIFFVSTRGQRWVNCWITQVGNLYRCEEDGSDIRQMSPNIEHDNCPWPLRDGRIIYTRWEYVDRSQLAYHHLWVTNPDGTAQMVYFGNQNPGQVYIDAKPLPGTDQVICIECRGHGKVEHTGRVVTLSIDNGPDDLDAIHLLTSDDKKAYNYRDPYPLTGDLFLVAHNNQLQVMDTQGHCETLHTLPAKEMMNEPRPVIARNREQVRPDMTDPSKTTGKLVLMDVTMGRNMEGVEPGTIKNLLIMETLPKPINYSGSMEPMSWGGTFTLERILGKIPVEPDGSAHMELPAKRSLFFIALDENDQAVKRMQSFLTVMPGELTSCLGCHEERTETPDSNSFKNLMALKRPVSQIEPVREVPQLYDYPNDIQPIWDQHCVRCHNPQNPAGGVQLTGDLGPMYSHSYFWLSMTQQLGDNRNQKVSNYPPYALGDAASELMKKIRNGHGRVKLSPVEMKTVQYWLHAGAPYLGSYAGLGTGMLGADFGKHQIDRADLRLPSIPAYQDVLARRCSECHQSVEAAPLDSGDVWDMKRILRSHAKAKRPLPNSASDILMRAEKIKYEGPLQRYLRHTVFNLTRPECSTILMAPLSKENGGYATAEEATHPLIFEDPNDPDYQAMLTMLWDASTLLTQKHKRWYMDGFVPHPFYIREMKRYGVLPATFNVESDPIDVLETDAAYFQQLGNFPTK